jgi:flagellar biogenesis protein FliO
MQTRKPAPQPDPEHEAARQTRSLAALAFVLALVVAGLFLVQTLRRNAQIEDCLLAGRRDCDRFLTR